MEDTIKIIGESLYRFQSAINESGNTLEDFIRENYVKKWLSDELYHANAIRTTFVNSINSFLASEGLINIEKVMLSIITDPLAHDIERTPAIQYKGHTYLTTHSMIYSKFLACSNPRLRGVYVDSPNIRLELESPVKAQRGRYLADFSQIDIELKRNRGLDLEAYLNKQSLVRDALNADMDTIKNFLERMIVHACEAINATNGDDLKKLGVVLETPAIPFPTFTKDHCTEKLRHETIRGKSRRGHKGPVFLDYGPHARELRPGLPLPPSGGRKGRSHIYSVGKHLQLRHLRQKHRPENRRTFSRQGDSFRCHPRMAFRTHHRAHSSTTGYSRCGPTYVTVISENINELGGYGPFLHFVSMKDAAGKPMFPDTMGGGIGVERTLYSILRGEKISKIDDITFFGKNPDTHPLYLY